MTEPPAPASRPARVRYGAAALSGVLLALAFPPFGLSFLAWVALVPWFALLLADGARAQKGPAVLFGFLFFTLGLSWLSPLSLFFPPGVALLMAIYPLLFAILARHAAPLGPTAQALLLPCLWVGLDLLRQHLLTGFPWLFPGHALAGCADLRQCADLGGAHLLTFLVVLANTAGAVLLAGDLPVRVRWGIGGAALLLPILSTAYGVERRESIRDRPGPRVLLVQPCFPQSLKKEARESLPSSERMRSEQLALTSTGLHEHGDADLVVWAETMIPGELEFATRGGRGPDIGTARYLGDLTDFMGIVREKDLRFLAGAKVRDADKGCRNAGLLLGPRGALQARFSKVRLVPFGEYIPLLSLLPAKTQDSILRWVMSFSPFPPDLLPGDAPPAELAIPGGRAVRLGGLVCYEVVFPGLARERALAGADVLVNLSNYAWYGAGMREQALDMTRLRAVETRRPVAVATNDGPTAVVDGNGEVRARLPEGQAGVLFAEVPLDGRGSLYLRVGDLFAWICAAAGLLGAGRGWRRGRRGGRAGSQNQPETPKNC